MLYDGPCLPRHYTPSVVTSSTDRIPAAGQRAVSASAPALATAILSGRGIGELSGGLSERIIAAPGVRVATSSNLDLPVRSWRIGDA